MRQPEPGTHSSSVRSETGAGSATGRHHERARELDKLERIANWMDSRFVIPFAGVRLGLDSVLGLVPGIGDGLAVLPAAYIVMRARQLGAPGFVQAQMAVNVIIDMLVGSVPLVGDLIDVGFKANRRNVALLRRHFSETADGGDMVDITPTKAA